MLASLTGAGLSAAAGFNAYIPFLLVALVSRYTDFINLPANFQWIESPWAIGIASVLLISEFVLDKIPVVDSINDTVGTVIRPMTGGLILPQPRLLRKSKLLRRSSKTTHGSVSCSVP